MQWHLFLPGQDLHPIHRPAPCNGQGWACDLYSSLLGTQQHHGVQEGAMPWSGGCSIGRVLLGANSLSASVPAADKTR